MPRFSKARHSLSHYRLATFDMGYLVPVGLIEVLPGDFFKHRSRVLLRVEPLLKPLMHPVDVRIHHWFVPNRLVWTEWDAFITNRESTTFPTISYQDGVSDHTLLGHLGVPAGQDHVLNAMPIRAYNLIYNYAYRDQNLIAEVSQDDLALKRVAWGKDYFTTARANPQYGAAGIQIPFSAGTTAPVGGRAPVGIQDSENSASDFNLDADYTSSGGSPLKKAITGLEFSQPANQDAGVDMPLWADADDALADMVADLSAVSGGGIDVNDLRSALAQQRFLEHRNRYGSRHEDYLRFLGIRPSDGRLSDPEYLGGGKNTIAFSEVLATAETGSTTNVGDLSGHGIAALATRRYRRFFEESGFVLSLMSIRPRTIYSQQLQKLWLRREYTDYWQKELESMGPEEIFTKEVYALHPNATDIFGYNGRHDTYRHLPSYVSGQFADGGTEEDWHLARDFASAPALNQTFIDCAPSDRAFADTTRPEIYANVSHSIDARRLVSKVSRH